uniref:Telomerase RNA component interacting RNase n=1 Tax=Accipiter nisus TaxID=211598 RepID=A0A8B9RW74_9AVES
MVGAGGGGLSPPSWTHHGEEVVIALDFGGDFGELLVEGVRDVVCRVGGDDEDAAAGGDSSDGAGGGASMEAHGEEGEAPSPPPGPGGGVNVFANDGSFLELFKRKMEAEQQREREAAAAAAAAEAPGGAGPGPVSRGRRGGNKLALKTGVVAKKQKTDEEVLTSKGDAWAKYMAEVKKYKAHQCSDDDKTRPLVK